MRKGVLIGLVALLLILAGTVWLEPTGVVRGWLKGEAFYRNRPTSYWGKALTTPDPKTEVEANQALKEGGQAAVPVLAELLHSDMVTARWKAADLLRQLGPEAQPAVSALVQALKDNDPHVQFVAATALEASGYTGPEAIPVLQELLGGEDRLPAVRALAHYGPRAAPAIPRLSELLRDTDSEVRWNAARTLGLIGPDAKAAVPDLVAALKDENSFVREHAAEALGDIGPDAKDAVAPLIERLKDADARVRRDAVRSLGQIGVRAKTTADAIRPLLKDTDKKVREAAQTSLTQVEPKDASR
jgi:HEAT repeat protein